MIDTIISQKYKLVQKIQIGQYFELFKATHIHNLTVVLIRLEKKSIADSKLFYEAKVIRQIQGDDEHPLDCGIPRLIQAASEGLFNYMIIEPFGICLAEKFALNNGMSIKETASIGLKMLQRIQLIHSTGYVHRDLRMQNFHYGHGKNAEKIYISGLSNCKKYIRADSRHVMYRDNKLNFTGTAKFVSINTQLGVQQSRRDDIQAFLYMLIYMMKKTLPWIQLRTGNRKQKYERILFTKIITPIETLCSELPIQFTQLLKQCRTMEYQQCPNYQSIQMKLKAVYKQEQLMDNQDD